MLVLLTGGPGQPGVPYIGRLPAKLGPVAQQYRIVMLDQRGTGGGALRCPDLQAQMGASDLYPPTAGAVRACAAAVGAKRAFYGTDDVVADLEALRQVLGVKRWTLDGISYGSYVAERYALAHPERTSRIVLDSVVPHTGSAWLETLVLPEAARVLGLACKDGGCAGDPAADLAAVVRKRHDGPKLLDALVFLSIVDPSLRTTFDVPALLHDARLGNTEQLDSMLATVHRWEAVPAEELSQGLHASALCGDWTYPWGRSDVSFAGRSAALAHAGARLSPKQVWPFDRATATGNGFELQCLAWPPTEPTPAVATDAKLRVPALLLAGDRDLSTPLSWARRELALAPQGKLVVVPGAGHSVQSRAASNAGRAAVQAFLLG